VQDCKNDIVQENKIPKPVNICYTGRLKGEIKKEMIERIIEKRLIKRRGPCGSERDNVVYWKTNGKINNDLQCGSEIHIDTSMGVVQIFGIHSNYRRITCKAFISKKQADRVVQYLCQMVIFSAFLCRHALLEISRKSNHPN